MDLSMDRRLRTDYLISSTQNHAIIGVATVVKRKSGIIILLIYI